MLNLNNKSLEKFIIGKYGNEFEIKEYKKEGKDHFLTLDFGDDEIINLIIRERKGENGNYRITMEG